ncbi:hypothetical protein R1flu_005159 [Riccia fluitans]|uniref:Translation initiation factor beta propellor-like domain-containing protein n=1 Tax=Riccia fluitans TaxID=41844 RepID=A0ABD1YSC2_9MARC
MDALIAAYESDEDDAVHKSVPGASQKSFDGREAKRMKTKTLWDPRPLSSTDSYLGDAGMGRLTGGASYSWSSGASVEQRNLQVNPAAPSLASGRYVSKRERPAAALAETTCSVTPTTHPVTDAGVKFILTPDLPYHIRRTLENIDPHASNFNRVPKGVTHQIQGHTNVINAVRWSPLHAPLLASASMDNAVRVWNVWNASEQQMVQQLSSHTGAVKDVQWSTDGKHLLSCGFDRTARLTDVEYGSEISVFTDEQFLNVVRFHPFERNIFLAGGGKGSLKMWDIRSRKHFKEYPKSMGQILDIDFNKDGRRFVSSSDIAKRNSSDKAIIVWDSDKQIALSNQVYLEAYTCPAVRYHPFEETFIAQSNASYIAIFSGRPPFKMNRYKRFEGHEVSANRIQCNFSPDGAFIVTGSADGTVHFYNFRSSSVLKKFDSHEQVCTDVSFHPVLPSVVASCSWDGRICIYE